jgi:hypothetical protein
MLYFFAQISTAGGAGASPPAQRTTRSPSGVALGGRHAAFANP